LTTSAELIEQLQARVAEKEAKNAEIAEKTATIAAMESKIVQLEEDLKKAREKDVSEAKDLQRFREDAERKAKRKREVDALLRDLPRKTKEMEDLMRSAKSTESILNYPSQLGKQGAVIGQAPRFEEYRDPQLRRAPSDYEELRLKRAASTTRPQDSTKAQPLLTPISQSTPDLLRSSPSMESLLNYPSQSGTQGGVMDQAPRFEGRQGGSFVRRQESTKTPSPPAPVVRQQRAQTRSQSPPRLASQQRSQTRSQSPPRQMSPSAPLLRQQDGRTRSQSPSQRVVRGGASGRRPR